jgi:RNA polymerase sigma-70 factor (ECF subfamily)
VTWAYVERGDREALAELYRHYHAAVLQYVHRRIPSRPLAEDIAAEVWAKAARRIGGLTWQGKDFGAWLLTVARNLVHDNHKSARHRYERSVGDVHDGPIDESRQPEPAVIARATSAALVAAIGRLPRAQGDVVRARFFRDLSVADTARDMGLSDGAVKALQYRAVRALRRLLEEEGFTR